MIVGPREIPPADIELPIKGTPGSRLPAAKLEALKNISTATAAAMLHRCGLPHITISGPRPTIPGTRIVGQAVTLQFMPGRADLEGDATQEDYERKLALWHVMDAIQDGDILVVAAKGDPKTGCLGEMLLTYLKGRGGIGAVVDGYVRDWSSIKSLEIPLWVKGLTPNYATQANLIPWAYNVPVDLCDVLVVPGDVILADDDGAVCVPFKCVDLLLEVGTSHEEWETFSRQKLAEGGSIWKYYPLKGTGLLEYEEWRRSNND